MASPLQGAYHEQADKLRFADLLQWTIASTRRFVPRFYYGICAEITEEGLELCFAFFFQNPTGHGGFAVIGEIEEIDQGTTGSGF